MVMLVPFTTALPPQSDYSDYAPRNADSDRACQTDEADGLTAEKPRDNNTKPDDEPSEEDFSKVLGMLLNAVTTPTKPEPTASETVKDATVAEVTASPLPTTNTSESSKDLVLSQPDLQASAQNIQKDLPQKQLELPHLQTPPATDIKTPLKPLPDSARVTDELVDAPITTAAAEPAQTQKIPVLTAMATPANELAMANANKASVTELMVTQQLNQEIRPELKVGLQQFASETTFTPALKPYETIKDTDAVTQEIMNALSRAMATSAPEKLPQGLEGASNGMPPVDIQVATNSVLPMSEETGSISSAGSSMNNATEPPSEVAGRLVPVSAASHDQPTGEQGDQHLRSGSDRGQKQTILRHRDLLQPAGTSVTSSVNDASRLSASGAVSLTLPDLTTSVSAEMRQPLSSQVSRAVMEHLERQSSAESETLTVQLDPPDLGEMVIELSKSKDGLSIKVTAREAVTMDMLLARGSEIESQLRGEKMDLRSLEFLSPDMMSGGAFQQQSSRDSSSLFDQSSATSRRNSRNEAATQVSSASVKRTGESQHALNFRA